MIYNREKSSQSNILSNYKAPDSDLVTSVKQYKADTQENPSRGFGLRTATVILALYTGLTSLIGCGDGDSTDKSKSPQDTAAQKDTIREKYQPVSQEVRKDINELKQKYTVLEQKLQDATQEHGATSQEVKDLRTEYEALGQRIEKLEEQKTTEYEALGQRIEKLEEQKTTQTQTIDQTPKVKENGKKPKKSLEEMIFQGIKPEQFNQLVSEGSPFYELHQKYGTDIEKIKAELNSPTANWYVSQLEGKSNNWVKWVRFDAALSTLGEEAQNELLYLAAITISNGNKDEGEKK